MVLDKNTFEKAIKAFYDDGGDVEQMLTAAIKTYLAEMFKPGTVMTLEPLEAIPQRDYRKELWIGIRLQDADIAEANAALADFDKTFPKENNHG